MNGWYGNDVNFDYYTKINPLKFERVYFDIIKIFA